MRRADPTERAGRRSFGPVVLLGLATAALSAVAASKPWMDTGTSPPPAGASAAALDTGTRYPLASATSLVLLAAWGVLLVTRGRVRRAFAVVALLAALAMVACVVAGYVTLPDAARDSFDELMGRGAREPGYTGWFWTAALAAVVGVVPAALAVRLSGRWPEMGTRYDAPGAARDRGRQDTADPQRDLWHALDEGRDPTDPARG
jgi:uncharacterized membrane protein (TIGR02234 family)